MQQKFLKSFNHPFCLLELIKYKKGSVVKLEKNIKKKDLSYV
jgi:hypothetical protein